MPHSNSAKKRNRQSLVRRARNRAGKSAVKGQIRKVRDLIGAGSVEEAATEFRVAVKKLDQTAARGIIHRNVSARLKSRLSAALKAAQPKAKETKAKKK
jgi:small subunit ribosomal protein S20